MYFFYFFCVTVLVYNIFYLATDLTWKQCIAQITEKYTFSAKYAFVRLPKGNCFLKVMSLAIIMF